MMPDEAPEELIWHSQIQPQMFGEDDDEESTDESTEEENRDDLELDDDSDDDSGVGGEGSKNPTLAALREKLVGEDGILPKSLHKLIYEEVIEPELTKWQSGVDEKLNEYAPYKDFLNLPPDYLQAAIGLAAMVRDDPAAALQNLAEHARRNNLDPAVVIGIAQKVDEAVKKDEEKEDDFSLAENDITKHPEFKKLQDQIAEQNKFISGETYQRQHATYLNQIDQTVEALKADHKGPKFDADAIMNRAMAINAMTTEVIPTDVLIGAAYKQWNDEATRTIQSARRAPRVGSGTARTPGASEKPQLKTREERVAAAMALAERFNSDEANQ